MGVSNVREAYINDAFDSLIPRFKKNNDLKEWMNFNVITTVRNQQNSIAYGSLFVIFKDEKYQIIFCYGYGDFKIVYNAQNAVFLGSENSYKYIATSVSSSYFSKDLEYFNSQYLVLFMNLVAFKVFGNKYNMELPYPDIK